MNYIQSFFQLLKHPLNKENKKRAILTIIYWKINQLFFHQGAIMELVPGIRCICYPESSYGSLVFYSRFPEFAEMNFLHKVLNKDDIFIDVGANIGVFSLLAASRIKDGKIYAFEPSEKALSNLYENIELNNLDQKIIVVKKVVSYHDKKVNFIIDKTSETNHIAYSCSNASKGVILDAVTLDTFCTREHIKRVNVIKIDVEGFDLNVLKGFERFLNQGKVEIIIMEVNKKLNFYGFTKADIYQFLKQKSFNIYIFINNKLKKVIDINKTPQKTFNLIAVFNKPKVLQRIRKFLI